MEANSRISSATSRLFQLALGPTAPQLGTGPDSLPNRLPAPNFELGIIAGTRSVNPLSGFFLPGESDGTVSVESTRLPGMSDFITVPTSRTSIRAVGATAGDEASSCGAATILSGPVP